MRRADIVHTQNSRVNYGKPLMSYFIHSLYTVTLAKPSHAYILKGRYVLVISSIGSMEAYGKWP